MDAGNEACAAWHLCPAGHGMLTEGTAKVDRQCAACVVGSTFSTAPTAAACTACTTCLTTEWESTAPAATSDRLCTEITASPTPAPTPHPCSDGSHGCDASEGGICVAGGDNNYTCTCKSSFYEITAHDPPQTAHQCASCPAGMVQGAKKTECVACDVGSVPVDGVCTRCPSGTKTTSTLASECVPCLTHETCGVGKIAMGCGFFLRKSQTKPGRHPFDFVDGNACITCPLQTYKAATYENGKPWTGVCKLCAAGTYAVDATSCVAHAGSGPAAAPRCTGVFGVNWGAAYCGKETQTLDAVCPGGKYKTMTFTPPISASYACHECPLGTYGDGSTTCKTCPESQLVNTHRSGCLGKLPAGTGGRGCFSGSGNCHPDGHCDVGCTVCPQGQFSKLPRPPMDRGVDVGTTYQYNTYAWSLYQSYLWTRHKKITEWMNWYDGDKTTFQNTGIRRDAPTTIIVGTVTDERQYLKCRMCPRGQHQDLAGQDHCVPGIATPALPTPAPFAPPTTL